MGTRHIMGHGRRGVLRPIIHNLHLLHLYPSGPLALCRQQMPLACYGFVSKVRRMLGFADGDPGSRSVRRGVLVSEGRRSF